MTMAEMLSRFLKDQVEVLGMTYLPAESFLKVFSTCSQ